MATVVAVWPNNTISIVRLRSGFTMVDLFSVIDVEASPIDAKCYQIAEDEDGLHVTFDWKHLDDGSTVTPESPEVCIGKLFGKIRHIPWPDDIVKQYMRQLSASARKQDRIDSARFLLAEEIPKFPAVPQPTHTADMVRRMNPFCGVYLSFDDHGACHYVGESEDVTKRVAKSRPEIANRMIGLVQCMPHDRKRIEAYFVAILDPPGNAASTHRMKAKEATDGTHAG